MRERLTTRVNGAWVAAVAMCALTFLGASSARAQIAPQNSCADCHLAAPTAPGLAHVHAWDRSPHGRANVACSACHGGNPTTFESFMAHSKMLPPRDPKSPLNPANIPATCGSCHAGPYGAFRDSRHYNLLRTGNQDGPTCVTCHGDTDGRVLSAKALASRCSNCHGPNEVAPRAGRMVEARVLYEELGVVREQMKLAQLLIKRVTDKKRRADLTFVYEQAELPLRRAVEVGHKFVYEDLRVNLGRAQERVNTLLASLANR